MATPEMRRIDQINGRLNVLRMLHAPSPRSDGPWCICGREAERCGSMTDLTSMDWLLDELTELAQAAGWYQFCAGRILAAAPGSVTLAEATVLANARDDLDRALSHFTSSIGGDDGD